MTPGPTTVPPVEGTLTGSATAPVVQVERTLNATPAEVWRAWTRPEQLIRWLGAVDESLDAVGRTVRVVMTVEEFPDDFAAAEYPARFEVRRADAPTDDAEGVLEFRFDDESDPGGVVTVTMAAAPGDRCHLTLRHALMPREGALEQAPGFGAGWAGFLDWLEDALAGRPRGADDRYDRELPGWKQLAEALRSI